MLRIFREGLFLPTQNKFNIFSSKGQEVWDEDNGGA
jgi:hypothetical protein